MICIVLHKINKSKIARPAKMHTTLGGDQNQTIISNRILAITP